MSNGIVAVTRRDSALEAFRHNPTDGSFAPSLDRVSTCTKCPNLRFLSYWAGLLSQLQVISRVKLTQFFSGWLIGLSVGLLAVAQTLALGKALAGLPGHSARRASALEAFRHNPTDGSFAPSFYRTRTCSKCPNLRFLSYWAGLLSQLQVISRVKLTCLTTV